MTYEKLKVILERAKESSSLDELIKKLGENQEFFLKKKRGSLSISQRKKYIESCVKFGLLNTMNYQLTELGNAALTNFDEILSKAIFNIEINGKKFKDILLQALATITIPVIEQIHEKLQMLHANIPIQELSYYLNLLARCGVLQKNRKYTYTFTNIDVNEFESILKQEYLRSSKDPMGQIWYEKYKEDIQNRYNLSEDQFNTLLSELQKKNPRLISLQRSRTKTWFALRDV
jgi:hypothetical protein